MCKSVLRWRNSSSLSYSEGLPRTGNQPTSLVGTGLDLNIICVNLYALDPWKLIFRAMRFCDLHES